MTEFWDHPDLLVVTGSRLYGVAKPDSDHDLRGFVVPPVDYVIGLKRFEQRQWNQPDDKIVYSIHKFVQLLLGSNTHALELLFAPHDMIIKSTAVGKRMIAARMSFVTRQSFRPFMGFSISEWRKVLGTRMEVEKLQPSQQRVIDMIREVYAPDKVWMDEIVELLTKNHARTEVPGTRHLGERRKAEIGKFGYSVKNAYHAIRLLNQGIELLETGQMTFPRPNAEYLRDIRDGRMTIAELTGE